MGPKIRILDIKSWEEEFLECHEAIRADPENTDLTGWLYILKALKQAEERESTAKKSRKHRGDPNSPSAPVRLRVIIDKTLVEFSELCGIKYETYRAIERETKKIPLPDDAISRRSAELIALATGVCPKALMENRLVCADGKTAYDCSIWYAYSNMVQYQHQKLESDWLRLFREAIEETIRFDKDEHDNGSFHRVVRLALLIDEFRDIYTRPKDKGKRERLVSALLKSTNSDNAKAAIERAAKIRKLVGLTTS